MNEHRIDFSICCNHSLYTSKLCQKVSQSKVGKSRQVKPIPRLYIDRLGHMIWLDSSILNCIESSQLIWTKIFKKLLVILQKIHHFYNKSSWSSGKHGGILYRWLPVQTLSQKLFFLIYHVSCSLQVKSNFHYLFTKIANIFCKWLYPKNQIRVIPTF